ncbi:MAG: T9SS type A sorting domain-containing protein [Flavobacteriales bacterium]
MGSNGYVTFGSGNTSLTPQTLPNTGTPNDIIAMCWTDLNPASGAAGTINYYTTGTSPNQVLIVNFIDVPHYGSSSLTVTFQLKLFEGTNCIEIHSEDIQSDAGNMTQGIENSTGTDGYAYPGRNNAVWSTQETFISFCPIDSTGLVYTWSTGDVGATVNGLQPGTYTVTASDLNGCFTTDEVVINAPQSALVSNLDYEDVTCFNLNDGSVDPGITGGFGSVNYAWSSGENGTSFSTLTDLGPGTYSVTATDAKNCTIEVNDVVIWEPSLLISAVTGVTGVVCPGDSTGAASGIAAGGISPYTYTWQPSGIGGQNATGLTNGAHILKVVDDNGCESFTTVNIIASSTTPVVDLGDDIFDPNGGTHTLDAGTHATYAWSGGGSGSTKEVTTSGTYTVTVTNEDGCEGYDEINVEIWPTGISQVAGEEFKVYPNPAFGILNIEFGTSFVNSTMTIIDAKGSVVMSIGLGDSGLQTMSVESIPAGVYTMSIHSDQSTVAQKLVISK